MTENFIDNFINNWLQDRNLQGFSERWANWMSELSIATCKFCVQHHGKIVDISILDNKTEVQAHRNCRCVYVAMRTKIAGTATNLGVEGADVYLFNFGRLPDYYINKQTAQNAGWQTTKKKFSALFPGKMIGGDVYNNDDCKLPSAPGRIWYEADINYISGKRNRQRILYSNDGLIFATYDHYQTFYEIIK